MCYIIIMPTLKAQSAGGRATALILRKKVVDAYYKNPNYCAYCKSIIQVNGHQKVPAVRKKKFCNHSCCAKYRNALLKIKYDICQSCTLKIPRQPRPNGVTFKRKFVIHAEHPSVPRDICLLIIREAMHTALYEDTHVLNI